MDESLLTTIDLEHLGFDRGGHLLVARALRDLAPGDRLVVEGTDVNLVLHLKSWARDAGHRVEGHEVVKGSAPSARWRNAQRAGTADEPAPTADLSWGLAARGALVEAGGPTMSMVDYSERDEVWTELAPKLYAQAVANQWDPNRAIDWTIETSLPVEVEDAVVQVMTYLIENEQAALVVPARHLTRIHPHFREVVGFLATQVADEARHVEVFTRRALLHRSELGTSSVGGRASLQTLVDEPDFSLASFLLTVLGEGTFLDLLSFIERYAPDEITRRIAQLTRQDEARHVAFGQAHLEHRVALDPSLGVRLRAAVEHRYEALRSSTGLNADVFDALVLLAAGRFTATAIESGWAHVQELQNAMHEGRSRRLVRLGFTAEEAAELSSLHTRNFM